MQLPRACGPTIVCSYYYGANDEWNFFYSATDTWCVERRGGGGHAAPRCVPRLHRAWHAPGRPPARSPPAGRRRGHKWALQTSHTVMNTTQDWDDNINSIVWPTGWKVEKVALNSTLLEMVPWMVGDGCYALVFKDSNFNSWHQVGGVHDPWPPGTPGRRRAAAKCLAGARPLVMHLSFLCLCPAQYTYDNMMVGSKGLLQAMGDTCTKLDAQYTMSGARGCRGSHEAARGGFDSGRRTQMGIPCSDIAACAA